MEALTPSCVSTELPQGLRPLRCAHIKNLIVLGHGLFIILGCACSPSRRPWIADLYGFSRLRRWGSDLRWRRSRASIGPAVLADSRTGLSSDGRGAYRSWADGVRHSIVREFVNISLNGASDSIKNPSHYSVNLNHPVPGA